MQVIAVLGDEDNNKNLKDVQGSTETKHKDTETGLNQKQEDSQQLGKRSDRSQENSKSSETKKNSGPLKNHISESGAVSIGHPERSSEMRSESAEGYKQKNRSRI